MITYRVMEEGDIDRVVPFYMEYYNTHDGDGWTYEPPTAGSTRFGAGRPPTAS